MDVFISHSLADKHLAEVLAADLRRRDVSVWLDLWSMSSGESIQTAISRALTDARTIILLIGSQAPSSELQRFEWRKALESTWSDPGKQLLGVLVGTNDPPPFLAQWKVLKIDSEGSAWDRVVDELVTYVREAKTQQGHRHRWGALAWKRADELQAWANVLSPTPQFLGEQKQKLQRLIREAGSADEICDRLFELAVVERELGELQEARETLRSALQISSKLGNRQRTAVLLVSLAATERKLGSFDVAISRLHEALDLYKSLNRSNDVLSTLSLLASFCRESGHADIGKKYLQQAIRLSRDIGEMAYPSTETLEHLSQQYERGEPDGPR
jgi:tetratricopeptide (TPR) repeat protein